LYLEKFHWTFFIPYIFLQGTFGQFFVLGHDCGHGSFSRYPLINDVIGTILHTFILTPYYPWKVTHRHHHKNTGNIDKDEIFYPIREKDFAPKVLPLFGLAIGWIYYIFAGYPPRPISHLNPKEKIFFRNYLGVVFSLGSLSSFGCLLIYGILKLGFQFMLFYYFLPVLVFASWLVVVTFLHHNETITEWYGNEKWTFVLGNIFTTVDRDYGLFHGITHSIGTHQIHHLFPIIPHYHLEEATSYFRKAYPQYVKISNEPIVSSFLRMYQKHRNQRIISNEAQYYRYQ